MINDLQAGTGRRRASKKETENSGESGGVREDQLQGRAHYWTQEKLAT